MSQAMPGGGTGLPPLTSQQIQSMLKGPTLQRVKDIRPGQCTQDDPQGTASNGTNGRIYTEEVRPYDPKAAERQRNAMHEVQACAISVFHCAAARSEITSGKVGGEISSGGYSAKIDSEKRTPEFGYDSSKAKKDGDKVKGKIEGEVCIKRRGSDGKNNFWKGKLNLMKGSLKISGEFPEGPFCLGGSWEASAEGGMINK